MNQVSRNVPYNQMYCLDEIHTYALKPFSSASYHKDIVSVSFQPSLNSKGVLKSTKPTFNLDSSAFTPAFILPIQQELQSDSIHEPADNFHLIREPNNQSNNHLLLAKPANRFCYVCNNQKFMQHIEHKIHKKNLKNSQFNHEIEDVIFQFQRNKTNKPQKRSFQSTNLTQSSINKHHKKIIVENIFTHAPNPIKLAKDASESTYCHFNHSEFQTKLTF